MTTRIKKTRTPKPGNRSRTPGKTKLDQLTALLVRPRGPSLAEMVATTRWQAHSVRGALAGALKRRGLEIASEKIDGVRRYRSGGTR